MTRSFAFAVAVPFLYVGAVAWRAGRDIDRAAVSHPHGALYDAGRAVASTAEPVVFILLAAAVATVALVQRRPAVAVGAAVAIGGTVVSADVLKHVFADAFGISGRAASFPSETAAVAAALGFALVLVAPLPAAATLGAAYAAALGASAIAIASHFPSDVLAGYFIAAAWVAAAAAATRRRHFPQRVAVITAAAALGATAAVAIADAAAPSATLHTVLALFVAAGVAATLAVAL